MGEVYRARDDELQREVAIKVLPDRLAGDDTAMSRFRREALLLASVNHPHIATIHGVEEAEGNRFLILELVEGSSLAQRLRRGPLGIEEALRINSQIAKALEAAHKRDVIHRDLKPANVMVSPEGWVKVLDFGVAKALEQGDPERMSTLAEGAALTGVSTGALTADGMLVGTLPYMSPEQARGEQIDKRSDIWAFGCVLFECLSGRRAFEAGSAPETLVAVLDRSPPWEALPAAVPAPVRTLLGRCLQKDPNRRLHSVADARIELEEALHPYLAPQQPPSTGAGAALPSPAPTPASGVDSASLGYLTTLGHYTVVERLGAGGIGEVYRAWDRERGCDVAVKVLRPGLVADGTAREGLRREARALAALRHPNIAAAQDFGTSSDLDYLVLEYVPGESLAAKLESGPLPEPEISRLGAQIAGALSEAHGRGILHRDLKSGNVLVTPDGQAKVIDFGLARFLPPNGKGAEGASQAGSAGGPLPYLAPEVVQGGEPDSRSDVYSLGVLLYQMATGRRPFAEGDAKQLTEAIVGRLPAPPSSVRRAVSPGLERVITRCLEKAPEDRYQTAREVETALEALLPASAVTGALRAGRRPRRRLAVLAAMAVVAAAGVLLALLGRPGSSRDGSVLEGIGSLVVMPTKVLDAATDPYLTDAIPSSLSTHLSQLEGLETKVPPTSLDVERVGGDLEKIAEAYGVEAMVLSTVSSQHDRLVVNLQLVDAASRNLLWSREYRQQGQRYPELAEGAAADLGQALRPAAPVVRSASREAGASEAEASLQQGLYYSNLYRNMGRGGDKDRALAAFERALEVDPTRADAAAEIAVLHVSSLATGVSVLEVLPEIRRWAERALEIDPRSSRAWAVLSEVEGGRTPASFRLKLEYALRAATYGPDDGYAQSRLAGPLAVFSPALALEAARQASRVDPLVLTSPLFEALLLAGRERWAEAIDRVEYALDIEPGMPFGLLVKALVLSSVEPEETLRLTAEELDPVVAQGQLPASWVSLARDVASFSLASSRGDREAADAAAERLASLARGELPFPRWQMSTGDVPAFLAQHGRTEAALELLRFRGEHGILPPYEDLVFDSRLEPVRADARFARFLADSKLNFEEMIAILEEARARAELPGYLEVPLAEQLRSLREARRERRAA